jgi:hypothetical protein
MKTYVSRYIVTRNGSVVQNVKSYSKGAITHRTAIDLMDEQGVIDNAPSYPFSIDIVIPVVNAKLDWTDVQSEIWTIQPRNGGTKTVYTGVKFLAEGESTGDGKAESTLKLDFIAETRTFE